VAYTAWQGTDLERLIHVGHELVPVPAVEAPVVSIQFSFRNALTFQSTAPPAQRRMVPGVDSSRQTMYVGEVHCARSVTCTLKIGTGDSRCKLGEAKRTVLRGAQQQSRARYQHRVAKTSKAANSPA
jgi:hypothetical protein